MVVNLLRMVTNFDGLHAASFAFTLLRRSTRSTLFPYTTLFRSRRTTRLPMRRSRLRSAATLRPAAPPKCGSTRSEEHTSELQSHSDLVCRLLLEKKDFCKN